LVAGIALHIATWARRVIPAPRGHHPA
jgi:hypothetical protein